MKDEDILFEKSYIPIYNTGKKVGTWQVTPIERGTKLFSETH